MGRPAQKDKQTMLLALAQTLCGTGHRKIRQASFGQLINIAKRTLQAIKPELVISGMALGWDQALACAAIELAIPFTAAIPFEDQPRLWSYEQTSQWHKIRMKAKSEVVLASAYNKAAYETRNRWMVDHSGIVLACWSGQAVGGTANAIRYAKAVKHHPQIINLWNEVLKCQ